MRVSLSVPVSSTTHKGGEGEGGNPQQAGLDTESETASKVESLL